MKNRVRSCDAPCFSLAICRKLWYSKSGATSTPVGGSPRILFGGEILLFAPNPKGKGVMVMNVTWEGIFQFCMVIMTVIALVRQDNNKKR